MLSLQQRINAFVQLGDFLKDYRLKEAKPNHQKFHTDLEKLVEMCYIYNGWFTPLNVNKALNGIESMLNEKDILSFSKSITEPKAPKKIAVIMAGNIPAVGFHDMLCVLLSGNKVLIKLSSDDHVLIPFLAGMLIYFEPEFAPYIHFAENKLSDFDAVIATGSNNSARYFDYYFKKYPHIIRKNRNSVAVLNGNESDADLKLLGHDILDYFGLGCRNVSKLFVPEGYNFSAFYEAIFDFKWVIDNKKYGNNYDYTRAIYLLDSVQFLDNNFLMLKEDKAFASPVSVVFHETYSDIASVEDFLLQNEEQLQCIVAKKLSKVKNVNFGQTQCPALTDYADNVNTLDFLMNLN